MSGHEQHPGGTFGTSKMTRERDDDDDHRRRDEEQPPPIMSPLDDQAMVGGAQERRWYLLISNPSKTTHLGTLIRCAAAFRAHQLLLVGYDKFNCQGSFGSHLFLDIVTFPTWDGVHEYLRLGGGDDGDGDHNIANDDEDESKCRPKKESEMSRLRNPISIIGILGAYGGGDEIFSHNGMSVYEGEDSFASLVPPEDGQNNMDNATTCLPQRSFPIHTRPFSSDVCFLLSRDKRGLPTSQARMCSGFVHVPHLSFDGDDTFPTTVHPPQESISNDESKTTQSSSSSFAGRTTKDPSMTTTTRITQSSLLDTATTLSIVLHHFTAWAGYAERTFAENHKFVKDAKPNARRRLCREIGQSNKEQARCGDDDMDAMDLMKLWKETGDALQSSDY